MKWLLQWRHEARVIRIDRYYHQHYQLFLMKGFLNSCVCVVDVFNRMFNWVVKVVPQPPGAPGTDEACKTFAAVRQDTHILTLGLYTHTVWFLSNPLFLFYLNRSPPKKETVRIYTAPLDMYVHMWGSPDFVWCFVCNLPQWRVLHWKTQKRLQRTGKTSPFTS